mgnify:CR=1 FL=1
MSVLVLGYIYFGIENGLNGTPKQKKNILFPVPRSQPEIELNGLRKT